MIDQDQEDAFGVDSLDGARAVRGDVATLGRSPGTPEALASGDRLKLAGLEKFVQNAVVAPQGDAGAKPILQLVTRLAAAGLIAAFAVMIPDTEAKAWDRPVGAGYNQSSIGAAFQAFRERRREIRHERNQQYLAAGAGLVGGLLLGGALGNGNRGYQQQPAYGNGYPAYGAGYPGGYQGGYGAYPSGGYGGGGYGSGYGPGYGGGRAMAPRAFAPSDEFTIQAKTLIAARIGSVTEADRVYDRFLRQAASCVQQIGGQGQCVVRFQEVSLDLARGEFIAAAGGQPVVVERQGRLNEIRPEIMQEARARAIDIKRQELSHGRGY